MIEAGLRLIRAVGANSRRLRRTKRISFRHPGLRPRREHFVGSGGTCLGRDRRRILELRLFKRRRRRRIAGQFVAKRAKERDRSKFARAGTMSWTLPVSGAASISNNVKRKTEALVHELQSNRTNMGPTKPANCVVILMAAMGPGAATGFPCQPRTGADNILVVGATGIEPATSASR